MFDFNKICGRNVFVRFVNDSERIVIFDGVERVLCLFDIVIVDEKRVIVVVGVMGGLDIEVDENIIFVFLEFVIFNFVMVRRIVWYLGFRIEVLNRFEKGLSLYFVEFVI